MTGYGIEKSILEEAELRRQIFGNIDREYEEYKEKMNYSKHICTFWDTSMFEDRQPYSYGEIRNLKG